MRPHSAPLVLLLACLVGSAAGAREPGDSTWTIQVNGLEREYRVHAPSAVRDGKPMPAVLIFHGGGSYDAAMERYSGLDEKADSEGFLAVYPQGSGFFKSRLLTWNAGSCCGYAKSQNIDDVTFTRALLDDLAKHFPLDERRIYATGMSNGAMMSHRLACELSDRIAAIAPVSGTLEVERCEPVRPVPVLDFHGTADQFVPYTGGVGDRSLSGTPFQSVAHTIQTWAKLNGCPSQPTTTDEPDRAEDGMRSRRNVYGPCRDGAEMILITIDGGGHTWPGKKPALKFLGPATLDLSANDLMWQFFQAHPLPDAKSAR